MQAFVMYSVRHGNRTVKWNSGSLQIGFATCSEGENERHWPHTRTLTPCKGAASISRRRKTVESKADLRLARWTSTGVLGDGWTRAWHGKESHGQTIT